MSRYAMSRLTTASDKMSTKHSRPSWTHKHARAVE